MESKFSIPTEEIELPSKGLLYSQDSPLASGKLEMKYMTAKEEDILTNRNLINNGTVIDKLLKSLIVNKEVNYNDLLIGDKNAVMIAARILSYGKDYDITYNGEKITVDLTTLQNIEIDDKKYSQGSNSFSFDLPSTGNAVTYKLLTHGDEKLLEREIEGLKKITKNSSPEVSTRMKYIITSVNGMTEKKDIRDFVDNYLLAKDARALRADYAKNQPNVKMTFLYTDEDGMQEDVDLPIGLSFFWPDAGWSSKYILTSSWNSFPR